MRRGQYKTMYHSVKPQVDSGLLEKNQKNAPGDGMSPGAFPYFELTCSYCRNPQLRKVFVEKCRNYSALSSATSSTASSASASAASAAGSSSVTPTRTLTVAVISR